MELPTEPYRPEALSPEALALIARALVRGLIAGRTVDLRADVRVYHDVNERPERPR